ncbi:MAG: DUF1638 domain-containing protein [Oscillospiraceae bacterium]|nr:DUF1638 domain-containing protein [Oscillospiraceae bacterium]MBQ4039922.1 DUF1638 domain-containing protein [Oscillospiraceae bacterium]MBQ9858511.1 DUF1638 domain-containing protein [Oscillospiraceae bacterium]
MKRLLLGCGTIQKELEEVIEQNGLDIDVIWLESGLHAVPNDLKKELQKHIDAAVGYDEVILGYGLCGNALLDITATHCDVLYPRTDDCISAFMCENCREAELRRDSYFLSRGWLTMKTSDSLIEQFNKVMEQYDEETAQEILEMMYGNYKRIVYLKVEDEIAPEDLALAKQRAADMNFEFEIEPATIKLYEKLILGDETYKGVQRLKKGETLNLKHFK